MILCLDRVSRPPSFTQSAWVAMTSAISGDIILASKMKMLFLPFNNNIKCNSVPSFSIPPFLFSLFFSSSPLRRHTSSHSSPSLFLCFARYCSIENRTENAVYLSCWCMYNNIFKFVSYQMTRRGYFETFLSYDFGNFRSWHLMSQTRPMVIVFPFAGCRHADQTDFPTSLT